MWYYIMENQVCKHVTRSVEDVNNWLKTNNKYIKKIYAKDFNQDMIIVEVK